LQEAVSNVLDNSFACGFTKAWVRIFTQTPSQVSFAFAQQRVFSAWRYNFVEDNGPGILEEDRQAISLIEAERDTHSCGTGTGLT
jgi:signal transduction histidine kinase